MTQETQHTRAVDQLSGERQVQRREDSGVPMEAPNHLIALALERGADPATLKELMDLQERWEAGQARKAYVAAMAAFKREAPAVLRKNDVVDFSTPKGHTNYRYANLGSIVQEITALLGKHDLSASWSTAQNGPEVTVTCYVTHTAGHREGVTLSGPIDESGNKNKIQAVGSTVTYLQRYTLLAALGLATGEDDDGRQGADEPPRGAAPEEDGPPCGECGTPTEHRSGTSKNGKDYEGYFCPANRDHPPIWGPRREVVPERDVDADAGSVTRDKDQDTLFALAKEAWPSEEPHLQICRALDLPDSGEGALREHWFAHGGTWKSAATAVAEVRRWQVQESLRLDEAAAKVNAYERLKGRGAPR